MAGHTGDTGTTLRMGAARRPAPSRHKEAGPHRQAGRLLRRHATAAAGNMSNPAIRMGQSVSPVARSITNTAATANAAHRVDNTAKSRVTLGIMVLSARPAHQGRRNFALWVDGIVGCRCALA
jgi:hypothetical protein